MDHRKQRDSSSGDHESCTTCWEEEEETAEELKDQYCHPLSSAARMAKDQSVSALKKSKDKSSETVSK